jgi:glycosyltransferase involved in cell wall biosynthesis
MNDLRASVLIAAYEHCDFLRRTLIGFTRQSVEDFEIVVCDDGSGPGVRDLVGSFDSTFAGKVSHCRHEKAGFRKCRILNEGVFRSKADYLIMVDADCIPHSRLVEEHLVSRKKGAYLVGRRVQLGPGFTERLGDDVIRSGRLESVLFTLLPAVLRGEARHIEAGIRIPSWLRGSGARNVPLLKGCNFSCWKGDIETINGFNEDFVTAGGGEDDDVERRLRLAGVTGRSIKHAAVCYHQHHPIVPRGVAGAELCKALAKEGRSTCERGLNLHVAR